MAILRSAAASAGASLVPSPTITVVLVEFPVAVADRYAVIDVVGEPTRVTKFGLALESLDARFTIEFVREYTGVDEQSMENQHSLVTTAVELGYYDTPREYSLTDLAEETGRAKSTRSETLHRAEGKIIKEHVEAGRDHARAGSPPQH